MNKKTISDKLAAVEAYLCCGSAQIPAEGRVADLVAATRFAVDALPTPHPVGDTLRLLSDYESATKLLANAEIELSGLMLIPVEPGLTYHDVDNLLREARAKVRVREVDADSARVKLVSAITAGAVEP